MKPQDLLFLLALIILLFIKNPKLFVIVGLFSMLLAIPLFYLQVFFTAQRLTMYAASFFLVAILLTLIAKRNDR